jgi:hypothetical protein
LAAPFAPAGFGNPAAQSLDGNRRLHAIQREQNNTDGGSKPTTFHEKTSQDSQDKKSC